MDPHRRAARAGRSRRRDAGRHGERRPGRSLGDGDRARAGECVKVLGRALREASATVPFRLVSFNGGKSRNAIPRDAVAVCSVAAGDEDAFRARSLPRRRRSATRSPRPTPACRSASSRPTPPATRGRAEATARLLDAVARVPTGPLAMSPDFDGPRRDETSLGEAGTEGERLTLHSLSRSSNDSALPEVIATLEAVARLDGR